MGRLSRSAVLLVVAALVLTGGGAYALASSLSSRTITVCVTHKGGALYRAKSCKRHDKKLSWNKQGPAGATGATGATGPAGPPGPAVGSISGAWSDSSAGLSGCDAVVLHSATLTLSRASAIYASASAAYSENGTNLRTGVLRFALYDSTGTTIVAASGQGFATVDTADQRGEVSIGQVLMPGDVFYSSGVYTAPAGQYTLKLLGSASDGSCTGSPLLWRPNMAYFTLG